MKRKVIKIDEEKCTGCGLCIPNCPEGALQIIDDKARLISDLFCDGLGACIGHCPEGAIEIEEREAEPYDERKVMGNIIKAGPNTIKAHLEHLREHGQSDFLKEAIEVLKEQGIDVPEKTVRPQPHFSGCPGSQSISLKKEAAKEDTVAGGRPSELTHWPVQMHLISPNAPQYQGSDLVLAADCVAFSMGDFHRDYLKGKSLAIACPKLDDGQDIYLEKIKALIDSAKINTLTVVIMEVPCCRGLLALAKKAAQEAERKIPIKLTVVSIQGDLLREEWM